MRRFAAVTLLACALALGVRAVRADEAAAWAALRAGEPVVALMRHGLAPGSGDPAGWRLDDCATQRNLDDEGRAEARSAGARLRQQRVRFAKVLSSPWCRCVETARLVEMGPVEVDDRFANAVMLPERRDALQRDGRAAIAAWKGPGPLLVVSHGETIRLLTGRSTSTAEIVVVRADADGTPREIGAIQPATKR